MKKHVTLAVIAMIAFISLSGCHSGPLAPQEGLDTGTTTTPSYGTQLESQEEVATEPDTKTLFNALNPAVDLAIVLSGTYRSTIKDVLKQGVPPADWSNAQDFFLDWNIADVAIVRRDDIFGDKPLIFIRFNAPLETAQKTDFDALIATANLAGGYLYDYDDNGQPDDTLFVAYPNSFTVTPTETEIASYLVKTTSSSKRIDCLSGVDTANLMGCGYIHGVALEKMLDMPAYNSSDAVIWAHLFNSMPPVIEAKMLDDGDQVMSGSWSLDYKSDFGEELLKKIFD